MPGYQLYRADRTAGRKKGGVAVYVDNTINKHCIDIGSGSTGAVEYQILFIDIWNLIVVVIYRPECSYDEFSYVLDRVAVAV